MESLSETLWDVVICGTGLPQSLLALALSRSDKKVLHIDPNDFYGGPEAAFSLQEADEWAERHRARPQDAAPSGAQAGSAQSPMTPIFASASVTRPGGGAGLSFARAYSLALAPQLVHARSRLVSELVSSRAFRQLEFLAVGSFFVLASQPPDSDAEGRTSPALQITRIPSTREDIFSDSSIPARAKRSLMKFLKFVLDYDSDAQAQLWRDDADKPLVDFLAKKFKLEEDLRAYVMTLTLSADSAISTKDGLAVIHRHLTSMGYFGPGFAAVYPKWGGAGEIAQVACRAGAVGGGVYMLGTGVQQIRTVPADPSADQHETVGLDLSNGTAVKAKVLVRGREDVPVAAHGKFERLSRLIAVVASPLASLFEPVVEGAPIPAVAVIACPPGSLNEVEGVSSQQYPVYVLVHSSDTGECPSGQSVVYLSTYATAHAKANLEQSLNSILAATSQETPQCLYQLYYEQSCASSTAHVDGQVFTFPAPSPALAVSDDILDKVHQAWKIVMGPDAEEHEEGYMKFADREGMGDYDDDS